MNDAAIAVGELSPTEAARLRWRCRRGMKELDIVLERYLAQGFPVAAPDERTAFIALLEREDPDLWSWLLGYADVPAEFAHVVERLRDIR